MTSEPFPLSEYIQSSLQTFQPLSMKRPVNGPDSALKRQRVSIADGDSTLLPSNGYIEKWSCKICWQLNPYMVTLYCGHTLCMECSIRIRETLSHAQMLFPCPFCRARVPQEIRYSLSMRDEILELKKTLASTPVPDPDPSSHPNTSPSTCANPLETKAGSDSTVNPGSDNATSTPLLPPATAALPNPPPPIPIPIPIPPPALDEKTRLLHHTSSAAFHNLELGKNLAQRLMQKLVSPATWTTGVLLRGRMGTSDLLFRHALKLLQSEYGLSVYALHKRQLAYVIKRDVPSPHVPTITYHTRPYDETKRTYGAPSSGHPTLVLKVDEEGMIHGQLVNCSVTWGPGPFTASNLTAPHPTATWSPRLSAAGSFLCKDCPP